MENELNEQTGDHEKLLEFLTTEVLYRVCDGKYDPDNDEAPEFHPGSKRNKKAKIKKYLSEQLDKIDFECEEGKIFRELILEMDTSQRRKKLVYRQQGRRIRELETVIRNHPEKMKTLEELLEVKEDQLKEKYEEKLAFGERNRQRANKQMERITQLNELVEDYRQNYVPKNDYEELRDTYTEDLLEAKKKLAKQEKTNVKKDSGKKEAKRKKMKALKKQMKKLEETTSSDSDSDAETLHFSVGTDSDSA